MTTLESLTKEFKEYENTLVLDSCGELVLFLGIIDGEDDFYYNCVAFGEAERHLASCCGWIHPLQGRIDAGGYFSLVSFWNHSNEVKANVPHEKGIYQKEYEET